VTPKDHLNLGVGLILSVSVDVAYSPDSNPVAFYIDLGHCF
jgi:hypothetical protein